MIFDSLITTPGSSGSNSLCSLDEADAYIAASFYDKAAWDAMFDAEKIALLILGGINFNCFEWLGYLCYENQVMCWPRWLAPVERETGHSTLGPFLWDYSEDDVPWSPPTTDYTADTIVFPEQIKVAQAWYSYDVYYRAIQNRTSPGAGPASDALRSYSLFGDISMSFSPELEVSMRDMSSISGLLRSHSPEIWSLMSPYVTEIYFGGYGWQSEGPTRLTEVLPDVAPTE